MKKIALLHYSAPPVVGGVESVLGHHARLFAENNQQVKILAGRGEWRETEIELALIPHLDSRHPEVMAIKIGLDKGYLPDEFEELSKKIEEELKDHLQECAVLVAHNVGSLHKNLPLTTALMRIAQQEDGVPLILWHHDLAWATPRYQSELYEGYPWAVLRTAWPGVKKHVVVSELRRRELAGLYGISESEIQVIPNGVDLISFLKLETQTEEIIASLDLFSAAPLLLLPVRITRRKNIEMAIRTISFLKRDYSKIKLLITGPLGPHNPTNLEYFNQLITLRDQLNLHSAVHFMAEIDPKFLPDNVIADFYRIADGLLFTSQEEGFGIPILEAGIVGLPVFCTDIPPLRELAGETATFFSPEEEPQKVAKLISEHLQSDRVTQMRQKVRQSYTWERIFHQLIQPLINQVERLS